MTPTLTTHPSEAVLRTSDADLPALLHELATRDSGDLPVVSAQVDLRPAGAGDDPTVREGLVALRDRLHAALVGLAPRSREVASLEADRERLAGLIEALDPDVRGLLVWACSGAGLWRVARLGVGVETRIRVAREPDLVGLARLVDRPRGLVGLADTNTLRLFRARHGGLADLGTPVDDAPEDYSQTEAGGWSQARYQRHVEDHRLHFAKRAAATLDQALREGDDDALLLCGDVVAVPPLESQLRPPARQRLAGVLRLEMRSSREAVARAALPVLEAHHRRLAGERADATIGAAEAGDLGATGLRTVRRALERGAVRELFVDLALDLPGTPLPELVRAAAARGAAVTFLDGHEALGACGQVAAMLRFRP